ncbi:MAG: hypothetical protein RR388_07755, partial [Rikenellaceae bacterium]
MKNRLFIIGISALSLLTSCYSTQSLRASASDDLYGDVPVYTTLKTSKPQTQPQTRPQYQQ